AMFTLATSAAVGTAVWGTLGALAAGGDERRLRSRLRNELGIRPERPRARDQIVGALTRLGERLASPFLDEDGQRKQHLRSALLRAGIYAPGALRLVVFARVLLLVLGALTGYAAALLLQTDWLVTVPMGGLSGYLMPRLWLASRIRKNHRLLERGLPDGLDLMVVCVE